VPVVLCVVGLAFVVGRVVGNDEAISVRENRTLAAWPALSEQTIRDGSFTRGVDTFIADRFPAREAFLDLAAAMADARGVSVDDDVYDGDALGDFGLDAKDVVDDDADAGSADEPDTAPDGGPDVADAGVIADVADAGVADVVAVRPKRKYKSGIAIVGDRGLMYLVGGDDTATGFAEALNTWAEALPAAVNLSAVITPTATHYYLPDDHRDRSERQDENLATVRRALNPRVAYVDVLTALAAHQDQDIFYKTDHHWTQRGAYYAYAAWAERAGFLPVDLADLERKTHPPVLGSLYRFTQSKVLKRAADPIEYWLPAVTYTAKRYKSLDEPPRKANFIVEREKSYAVFLGGDDPLLIAETSIDNGRKALLVKNSYGNALAPFLLHHFAEVVVVDYRYYDRSLKKLIEDRGITDVILQNATVTANTRAHARRMKDVLTGRGQAWEAVTPEKQAEEIKAFQEKHGTPAQTP